MKKFISVLVSVFVLFGSFVLAANADSAAPVEAKYSVNGAYDVKTVKFNSGEKRFSIYKLWYPAALETEARSYPVIVYSNGTGAVCDTEGDFLTFLASWGYIVVGNDDKATGLGESSSKGLDFVLSLNEKADSLFFGKVDADKIALVGHSQGGSSTINAASIGKYDNAAFVKTIVAISAPHAALAASFWQQTPYDASLVSCPAFLIAGDGAVDAGDGKSDENGICRLDIGLTANMNSIRNDNVVIGQRVDTDHGTIVKNGRGYVMAWLNAILLNDAECAAAFDSQDGEFYNNDNWQNTRHKTSGAAGKEVISPKPYEKKESVFSRIVSAIKNLFQKITELFRKVFSR